MNIKFITLALFILGSLSVKAQLYVNSAQLTIQTGASVIVQGDVTSNTDIIGDGKIVLNGSANQNVSMSGFTIPNLEVNNAANVTLTTPAQIGTSLLFTSGNILIGNNDLTFASIATASNYTSARFVVTNGNGKLVKSALANTTFTFPIGNTTVAYNPVAITNTGTVDNIAVRCLANAYSTGLTGAAFTKEVVDASWDISESVAGGSNLSVTATWNSSDELTGFNRTKAGISNYITSPSPNVGWDMLNSQTALATGTGPYTYTRTGISSLGAFAIGTRPVLSPLLVTPKIFLQGNYVSGTGLMTDALRTLNLIPTTEPYSGATGFTHSGSGGGETTTSAIVGSTATAGANAIVDWVFVQLYNSAGTLVNSRSALLQRDGDIVETDGISPLNMAGNAAGNYYISVRHRNHLGVKSNALFALAKTTASPYDFTNALNNAFLGSVTTNAAMATVGTNIFGMWAGNANDDIAVKMSGLTVANNDYLKLLNTLGSSTAIISSVYSKQDLNMDGKVNMAGLTPANNDYLKLLNSLGSNTKTVTQPTF